jgi:hypothetical protein
MKVNARLAHSVERMSSSACGRFLKFLEPKLIAWAKAALPAEADVAD